MLAPWEKVSEFLFYRGTFHKILYDLLWHCDRGFKFGRYMTDVILHHTLCLKLVLSQWERVGQFLTYENTFHKIPYNLHWHCDHDFKFGRHIRKVILYCILRLKLVLTLWDRVGEFLLYGGTFHKILYNLLWYCDHGFKFGRHIKKVTL